MQLLIIAGITMALLGNSAAWSDDLLTQKERGCKYEGQTIEHIARRRDAGSSLLDSLSFLRRLGEQSGI